MLQSKATRVQPELTPRQPADEDEMDFADYQGMEMFGGSGIAEVWEAITKFFQGTGI